MDITTTTRGGFEFAWALDFPQRETSDVTHQGKVAILILDSLTPNAAPPPRSPAAALADSVDRTITDFF